MMKQAFRSYLASIHPKNIKKAIDNVCTMVYYYSVLYTARRLPNAENRVRFFGHILCHRLDHAGFVPYFFLIRHVQYRGLCFPHRFHRIGKLPVDGAGLVLGVLAQKHRTKVKKLSVWGFVLNAVSLAPMAYLLMEIITEKLNALFY